MTNKILPDFQDFLIQKNLVPDHKVSFYALWVKKLIDFSNTKHEISPDLQKSTFLNSLQEDKNIASWQVKQAEDALNLYFNNFLTLSTADVYINTQNNKVENDDISSILTKLRESIRLKHYSYRTENTYIEWVRRFFKYLSNTENKKTSIEDITSEDVRNFLSFLALQKQVSASTQNQAFNALLFLFRNILNKELSGLGNTVRAKRGSKLPVVLSRKEIKDLFQHIDGKNALILKLLYGAGLRLMEAARLRVKDIDFNEDLLFIRSSKGDKDRKTILPESVKKDLLMHLDKVKSLHEQDLSNGFGEVYLPYALERKYPHAAKEWGWQYVFPAPGLSTDPFSGKIRRHHFGEKAIQNAVRQASQKAGIIKHVTVHTLRHSFATHLLMNGVNIRQIQDLLGHKNVETTMIYTHVLRDMANTPQSPLDSLDSIDDKL